MSERTNSMPGVNISQVEAQERSKYLHIESYDVTLKIVPDQETFYSKSMVRFSCNQPGIDTFIDAPARRIISATLNGVAIDISHFDGETVFLKNLAAENELVIESDAIFSKDGEGLQYSVDPADQEVYLYSQCAPALTRHMYACFDQPDLKATFTLTATVPNHWEAISNSPVESKIPAGSEYTTWRFFPTARIATYVTAFIAGPYHHVHDDYVGEKKIPLGLYCRKSLAPHLDHEAIFKITKQGFKYFEKVFGLAYPFDKYDQIAVVDYNWGAMENVGAVTFKEELFVYRSKVTERLYKYRVNTILHEMSHMWFGNLVTMQWWDDLWLNESFATWAAFTATDECTEFKNTWTDFNARQKTWALRQDQLSSTHPIVVDVKDIETANSNFDGITYAKGASVLMQFVAYVGRDNFIRGLQKYFAKHAYKNTTLADLLAEMEATSGRDLKAWSATWLQTAGVNTLRPVLEISGGIYTAAGIKQEAPTMPAGSTELRPHRMAIGLYDLRHGSLLRRKIVELDVSGAITHVPELIGEKAADLVLINDKDMTYAKTRFDANSIATLKSHIGDISDSLARALCFSATWDMLRDAEISSTDFVDIALAGLPGESEITVVAQIAEQLAIAVNQYAHPSVRDALRSRTASGLESLLDSAEPGSDHQLQYARSFATLAITPEQNQRILSVLKGQLQGLTLDADMRWHLLCALAERGLITRVELDKELEKDPSTLGELSHLHAIAALPTPADKAKAWAQIVSEETSNANRIALINGFNSALNRDLIESYVDNYFEMLLIMSERKSFESATRFTEYAFPIYITTQTTLDKANYWLDVTGKDAASALRRRIAEARDSLARALRVQSREV
ncbi:MAG TPA: aminopeptidase N [Candidatus Paceibacterota bacterium]|nr:aminopeptidase N [Candidatus Paceibacterota bacterium]